MTRMWSPSENATTTCAPNYVWTVLCGYCGLCCTTTLSGDIGKGTQLSFACPHCGHEIRINYREDSQ